MVASAAGPVWQTPPPRPRPAKVAAISRPARVALETDVEGVTS